MPGVSGCLPEYFETQWPPESNLPNPPRAAKFTSDGRAIVRARGAACFTYGAIDSLARYDLATAQENVLSIPQQAAILAFSRLGQVVVTEGGAALHLGSWPASLAQLDIPDPDPNYFTPPVHGTIRSPTTADT